MNRFGNPINNGQHRDSTVADVNIMKRRGNFRITLKEIR